MIISDLLGTFKNTFRVNKVTFDSSGATAQRTASMPDKSGTVAMLSDIPSSVDHGLITGTVDSVTDYGSIV